MVGRKSVLCQVALRVYLLATVNVLAQAAVRNVIKCFPLSQEESKHLRDAILKRQETINNNKNLHVIIPRNCNRQMIKESGCITSPNWPRKSIDFKDCRVSVLTIDDGRRVLLTFNNFTLEGNDRCTHNNYIEVNDVKSNRINKYCGTLHPFTWLTDSNYFMVEMRAPSDKEFNWFNATYERFKPAPANACSQVFTADSGSYTSPNVFRGASHNHYSKTNCEIVIRTHPNKRISVVFKQIHIEDCANPLTVTDLLTNRHDTLCGAHALISWTSDSNQVLIEYISNNKRNLKLALAYKTSQRPANRSCSRFVVKLDELISGVELESPNYPQPYPSNLDCQIILRTSPSHLVLLNFTDFVFEPPLVVEGKKLCVNDFLEMQDISTNRLYHFCDSYHNFSWTSDSNEVVLTYKTNELLDYTGFHLTATAVPRQPSPDCMAITNTNPFILTSLNYPSSYPPNLKCEIVIHEMPSQYVTVDFHEFKLEGGDCINDHLKLTTVASNTSEIFCGVLNSFSWTSDANEANIAFKTNSKIEKSGFEAACSVLSRPFRTLENSECNMMLREKSGRIQLPVNPDWPPHRGSDCLIVIHVGPGEKILLSFVKFKVSDLHKDQDYVEIRDITVTGNEHRSRYSGHLDPFTWTSSRNELAVLIHDENAIATVAFIADYEALPRSVVGCERVFTADTGIINWPAEFSPESTHCDITIRTRPSKVIIVTFEEFKMDGGSQCSLHSMTIQDRTTKRSDLLCSTQWEFSWMSESNEINIALTHQQDIHVAVKARYRVVPRSPVSAFNQFFSSPDGILSSLKHNRDEILGKNCSFVIQVNPEHRVVVSITDFLVGNKQKENKPKLECRNEFVEFKDLTTGRNNTYCGEFDIFIWSSDSNLMSITFHIDKYPTYSVFRARYSSLLKVEGCDHISENIRGTISTVNFPKPYPGNSRCRHVIHAQPGSLLTLKFEEFDLFPEECKDFTKIVDLGTNRQSKICGSQPLFSWTSDTNEVIVEFHSSGHNVHHKGVKATYERIQRSLIEECYVRLFDPTVPIQVPSNFVVKNAEHAYCQFYLHTDPSHIIQLTVKEFDEVSNCSDSGIVLTDIATARTNEYCDIAHMFSWTAETNELHIGLFARKDSLPNFLARWKLIPRVTESFVNDRAFSGIHVVSLENNDFVPVKLILYTVPNNRVVLVIEVLEVYNINCDEFKISVADSTSLRSNDYCEVTQSHSWVSDSNEVIVSFSQQTSFRFEGQFYSLVKAPESDCNKVLLESNLEFESINYPEFYPNNMECDILIHTSKQLRVQIVFKEFWFEQTSDDVCHDFVQVIDTTTGYNETICGRHDTFSWTSEGNSILLQIRTDENVNHIGYLAEYTLLNDPVCADYCNKTYFGPHGNFVSPNIANNIQEYDNNLLCYYFLKGKARERIFIDFHFFDVQLQMPCTRDYLLIEDVASGKSNVICGSHPHLTWESDSNEVNITFITDENQVFGGFNASYKMELNHPSSICDQVFHKSSGNFWSPRYPSKYPNDYDCVYTILVAKDYLIVVTFEHFKLEESDECSNDYVEVSSEGLGRKIRFCGAKDQFDWKSANNHAVLTFHSDHVVTDIGFSASYHLIEIENPSGIMTLAILLIVIIVLSLISSFTDVKTGRSSERLCGSLEGPLTWESDSNEVQLVFKSDDMLQRTGFYGTFHSVPSSNLHARQTDGVVIIPPNCDRQLQSDTGCITSPNWPRKSVDFTECQVKVEVQSTKRILLTFNNFTLEGTNICDKNNYVQIRDENSNRNNRYCGTFHPFTWLTDSNELSVTMNALSKKLFNRYNATYRTLDEAPNNDCSVVLVGEFGRYSSSDLTEKDHIFHYPIQSSPMNQPAIKDCEVVIHANPNERVSVSFREINIPNCQHPLKIRDLLTERTKNVCGKHELVSWTSDANVVVITYKSDIRTTVELDYEFLLRPSNKSCSDLVIGIPEDGLELTSPNFPRPYPSNLDCQIILHTSFDNVISLNFSEFTLEPPKGQHKVETCLADYIEIRDISTEVISQLCGSYHNFSWTSQSNEVVVTLKTNHLLDYTGFKAIAKSLIRLPAPDCVTITRKGESSFVLTSLNYPEDYPKDVSCTLLLQEHPDKYIVFDFEEFDLQDSQQCSSDYVEFNSLTSGLLSERLCGEKEPFTMTSDSNEVSLTFKSDSTNQRSGFKAYCTVVHRPTRTLENTECSTMLREKSGRIQLPANPDWPPIKGSDCLIIIHAEPHEKIRLNFVTFVVSDLDSDKDFVEIYDIALHGETNRATFTGHLDPFTWTSFRNELAIYVRDENEISSVSFIADYEVLSRSEDGCESLFTNKAGVVSLKGTGSIGHCNVVIRTDPDKRVLLTFKTMKMDKADCAEHSLTVLDTTTKRQSQYCSTLWEFSWLSDSNEITLDFRRNLKTYAEIQAIYSVIPRTKQSFFNQFLTAPDGIISSLEHNRDEIVGKNCTVFIQTNPETSIVVSLTDFLIGDEQTKNSESITCTGEQFLEIKDLTTGRSNVYCGEFDLFTWTSDHNLVAITFHITTYPTYNVFRAAYRSIPIIEGCDNRIIKPTGIIVSSNFPLPYQSNIDCRHIVHSEPGNLVSFNFTDFEIQPCETDYVELLDLGSGRIEKLCGSYPLFSWTSDTNEVSVRFNSGPRSSKFTGFRAKYKHVQRPLVNECYVRHNDTKVFVELPKFVIKDIANADCLLYIYTHPTNRIQLTFDDFAEVFNCSDSGIEVTDVATERTNTYCAISHPFSWTTDTNELKLRVFARKDKLPRMVAKWKAVVRTGEPVVALADSANILLPADHQSYQLLIHTAPNYRLVINYIHLPAILQRCDTESITITDSTTLRTFRDCKFFDGIMSWVSDSNEVILDARHPPSRDTRVYYTAVLKVPPSECSKVLTSDSNSETNSDFETANYPDLYPNDIACDMIIQTETDCRIQIVFEQFWLEKPNLMGCNNDFLNVTDTSVGLIYDHSERICDRHQPSSWTSEGNSLLLRLETDKTLAHTGYLAQYTILKRPLPAPHCNITYLGPNGIVQSPNMAKGHPQYENNVLCFYLLKGNVGEKIVIDFTLFDVELETPCQRDYVKIEDVATGKTNIICGQHYNLIWESESNEVNITFVSDESRVFGGFNASYQMEPKTRISYCDEILTDNAGTFQSPNYPAKYANDLDCVYSIIADPNYIIEVKFEYFDLEPSQHCTDDYIELSSVGEGITERHCDHQNLLKWNSTTNSAIIKLHTDHIVTDTGFRASFKTHQKRMEIESCSRDLPRPSGMFSSPNFPSNYGNNLQCVFTITVSQNKVVRIDFLEFDIEPPTLGYCSDYVQISQGPKLCGQLQGHSVISNNNVVVVTFYSDGSNTYPGFKALYVERTKPATPTTVSPTLPPFCNFNAGRLTENYGVVHSPQFPSYYPNNEFCRTTIETKINTHIIVTIRFMDIENYKLCDWDYLQIIDDVTGRSSEKLCGSLDAPLVWESDSNRITLIFKSDDILARTGYYGTYQAVAITEESPFEKPGFENPSAKKPLAKPTIKSKPKPKLNNKISIGHGPF
ncbi:cubilin-like [Anneissia japonica]|uniref:cubilin-like n=1 Tax=Anneissia japonica TaxID=1529436 RepID=UPI001425AEF2|nr:cubilin-like [Anneissia japonica]